MSEDVRNERVFFAISERDGKDSKGRFLLRGGNPTDGRVWDSVDHDFERIVEAFHKSMEESELGWSRGTALCNVKKVGGLGQELVLAPERYDPRRASLTEAKEATRNSAWRGCRSYAGNCEPQGDGGSDTFSGT